MGTLLKAVIYWITYNAKNKLAININRIYCSYFITNNTSAAMNVLICFTSTKSIPSLTILAKKGPDNVVFRIKFFIPNAVLRVSRRKNLKFFPCGTFSSCVSNETSPVLKNFWLRPCFHTNPILSSCFKHRFPHLTYCFPQLDYRISLSIAFSCTQMSN